MTKRKRRQSLRDGANTRHERYLPLMLILSPSFASVRISAQSEIIREVPPPPLDVSSCFSREETAGPLQLCCDSMTQSRGDKLTADSFDNAGKHCGLEARRLCVVIYRVLLSSKESG